jgi:hypothetical protein
MVVPANDSYLPDPGFADDASEAMPAFDADAMPMDGDTAAPPEAESVDGAATPEAEPFSVESLSLTPEQLAALDAHYTAQLAPQWEAQAAEQERLFADQRQSLEGKVKAYDADRVKASAWFSAAQDVIGQLLTEVGADQTTQDAIKFRVQHLAQQRLQTHAHKLAQAQTQSQQVQQQQTAAQAHFQSEVSRVRGLAHDHAKSVGLDVTHPAVDQSFDKLVLPAARALARDPDNADLIEALEAAKAAHKERVTELGTQARRRKDAKPASDAVKRQQNRGVQNLTRGGAGAAPMALPEVIAALQRQHPTLEYDEIHPMAWAQYNAARQSRQ